MMHLSSEYERTHEVKKDWVHGRMYEKTITKSNVISKVLKLWPGTVKDLFLVLYASILVWV